VGKGLRRDQNLKRKTLIGKQDEWFNQRESPAISKNKSRKAESRVKRIREAKARARGSRRPLGGPAVDEEKRGSQRLLAPSGREYSGRFHLAVRYTHPTTLIEKGGTFATFTASKAQTERF